MKDNFAFEIGSWYIWYNSLGSSSYGKYWRRATSVGTPGYEFKPYFPETAYSLIIGDKCMKQFLDNCSIAKFVGPIEYLELFL